MLFDLQGRRRRVVQATYLTLAVLMGGGLVFFGIGGDVSGGLFDAIGDRGGGGSSGNEVIEDRIDKNQELAAKPGPKREEALGELVRDYASLASAKLGTTDPDAEDIKDDYRNVVKYWEPYEKIADPLDTALANYAVQAYQVLEQPDKALDVAQILAEKDNTANGYLTLMDIAAAANNTRLRDLAADKALDLATKSERATVKARIKAAKQPPAAPTGEGTTGGGG